MADDLMQLQRQAARRVQQMQEHSRRVFEAHQGHPPHPLGEPPWQGELTSPGLYGKRPAPPNTPPCEEAAAAPAFHLEAEQWLLLGLAVLLLKSGCRTELLLALLYLAM